MMNNKANINKNKINEHFFPGGVDTGQKYPKSLKFIAGVNDNADKTVLTIPACLGLKMKNKQKLNLRE
jgi:hypothetical protein